MRARAEVVGQALGGGPQVGARRQADEADHEAVLVEDADLDLAVGDGDGHLVAWDGAHGPSSGG